MRFSRTRHLVQAVICGGVCAVVAAVYFLQEQGYGGDTFVRWEHRYRDALTRNGRFNPPDPRLVFLGIDSASVSMSELDLPTLSPTPGSAEERALQLMASGWPWPREVYALAAERLFAAGARAVVLDLLLPKAGVGDETLAEAMRRHPGRLMLGSNFVLEAMGGGSDSWRLALPTGTVLPAPEQAEQVTGFVNFWPDFDGVVRHAHYYRTLDQLEGAPAPAAVTAETGVSLAMRAAATMRLAPLPEPFRPRLVRFTGPPGTFSPQPVYQIFAPDYWERNFAGGSAFRDRIVLIGPAGNWQHDEHPTPFGSMPGPELHLNTLNALLHGAFLQEWPRWMSALLIVLAAVTAWLLTVALSRAWLRLVAFAVAAAAYVLLVKLAYDRLDTALLAVPPLLTLGLSGLGAFVYDYARETVEKLRARRTLEAYVSREVAREVLDNPASYLHALGGIRTEVALLMTDLRGFTTISEQMDSTRLVAQLNEYLSAMIEEIFAVRGSVDKFIGDAILAVWGHLNSAGATTDTTRAIEAFFRMRSSLARLNADWEKRGMPALQMGCGVNFGEVVFGNIGSARKRELTVIGDPVNVTARLESLTKEYGRELLIGPAAADLVREAYTLQFIDRLKVKGKTSALDLYSVVGPADEKREPALSSYLEIYERAQVALRGSAFAEAANLFRECLERLPEDKVAARHLERCRAQL